MTWREFVVKNTRGNLRLYAGYLLSGALAVTMMFMFLCFMYNSEILHGHMSEFSRQLFSVCRWIVAFFSVFFIFFFHAGVLRLRGREFGILQVLGMTKKQLARYVVSESLVMDGLAIILGLGAGLVGTKLFLLVMGHLLALPSPISFEAPLPAWLWTIGTFVFVFILESLFVAWRVRRITPKGMLLTPRAHQGPPKASVKLAIFSVLCLAAAYFLAVVLSRMAIMVIPILLLSITGTYFLFTQALVWFLKKVKPRMKSGIGLLIVSRLSHRIKDFARLYAIVAVVSAMILTSMGTVYGMYRVNTSTISQITPYALMLQYNTHGKPGPILTREQIDNALQTKHVAIKNRVSFPMLKVRVNTGMVKSSASYLNMMAVPESDARQALLTLGSTGQIPNVAKGSTALLAPYPIQKLTLSRTGRANVISGDGTVLQSLHVVGQYNLRIQNEGPESDFVLVLNDEDYASLVHMVPKSAQYTTVGWTSTNVKAVYSAIEPKLNDYHVSSSVVEREYSFQYTYREDMVQVFGVMMFAGMFLGGLFLLVCCSLIYLRTQGNLVSDVKEFTALRRLGMRKKEMGRILSIEFGLIFFLPLVVAILHSAFAMVDFLNLLDSPNPGPAWTAYGTVVILYTLFIAIYLFAARSTFMRQLSIRSTTSR